MINEFTCVILAGGENKRMGRDKAFMLFFGKPLIESTIESLGALFRKLLIVTNQPFRYKKYGIKTQRDILFNRGPLGGVYTALLTSESKYNFIIACDMPVINQGLIRYMVDESSDYDVVVPEYGGKLHPLYAVYSNECLRFIEKQLSRKNFRITDTFKNLRTKIIAEEEVRKFDSRGECFLNINTPQDYQKFNNSPGAN